MKLTDPCVRYYYTYGVMGYLIFTAPLFKLPKTHRQKISRTFSFYSFCCESFYFAQCAVRFALVQYDITAINLQSCLRVLLLIFEQETLIRRSTGRVQEGSEGCFCWCKISSCLVVNRRMLFVSLFTASSNLLQETFIEIY